MMQIKCQVSEIKQLAESTFHIVLKPETMVNFTAGQYLLICVDETDKRPFSIANTPQVDGTLELQIGAATYNAYAIEVVERLKKVKALNEVIYIEAPVGNAFFQSAPAQPLLLIAGGTGFSYIRSLLQHCIETVHNAPVFLYWGVKDSSQLYALAELTEMVERQSNLHFVPVVEDMTPEDKTITQIKKGNVLEAVIEDFDSLATFDIYIAGRFDMAAKARDIFINDKSASIERLYGDAYAFI